MDSLRQALEGLGWPSGMSDRQIAEELLNRWLQAQPEAPFVINDAAILARGLYAALLREDNLAALAWDRKRRRSPARLAPSVDVIIHAQQCKHDDADDDFILANRRKSPRQPHAAPVDVTMDYGVRRATGWLVDVSPDGAAVLMDSGSVPPIGAQIEPVIHLRSGLADTLGSALVVRTESLSHEIGLVGLELDEPREHLAA